MMVRSWPPWAIASSGSADHLYRPRHRRGPPQFGQRLIPRSPSTAGNTNELKVAVKRLFGISAKTGGFGERIADGLIAEPCGRSGEKSVTLR